MHSLVGSVSRTFGFEAAITTHIRVISLFKLLLIHNDSSHVQELNILLTNRGFNTYLAEDVLNGIEIAKIYTPDLILCSIRENGIDHCQVVSELARHERTHAIPLIFIASAPSFEEMRSIMNAGADDYIPYPMDHEDLIQSLHTRIKKRNAIKNKFDRGVQEGIESPGELPFSENHVLVKIGNQLRVIKFPEIICVLALKECSKIITNDGKRFVIRKSLKKWMEVLPAQSFMQIHRSTIINLDCVSKIQTNSEGSHEVILHQIDSPFQVSVRNLKKIRKLGFRG